MAVNTRLMKGLRAQDVWAVLSDGTSYGYWVVGTRGVKEVTGSWPAPGSVIHYVVGRLPLRKDDITRSVESDPGRRLQLEAHAWPLGSLHIELRLLDSPTGVTVAIEEGPKKGLLKVIDNPLVDLAIKARNVETLRRLEKRARKLQISAGRPAASE